MVVLKPSPSGRLALPCPQRRCYTPIRTAAATSSGDTSTKINGLAPSERFFRKGLEGSERQQLFGTISPVYDQLNDQLSFGMHKIWKRMTVKWSGAKQGQRVIDLCCGSGDLTFLLADAVGRSGSVVGLDFSAPMLDDAAARQTSTSFEALAPIQWVQGDAMQLPFDDESFDAATMGYGLRNVSSIQSALREVHRVLRPSCKAAILDFNNSADPFVDSVQKWMLDNLVVPAADRQGVGDEYRYLRPSIERFPRGKEQEQLSLEAGFSKAVHYEIGFGFMGVLVLTK